jgi:predicted ATPase
VHRLQGELFLPDVEQAAACFERALAVARQQQARSFELRAAVAMARLHLSAGRSKRAKTLLEDALAPFTEGFDSADLVAAKRLLDQSASSSSPSS